MALGALLEGLTAGRRTRTVGASGSARAWLLSRLARSTKRPLLCITPDEDGADALASDLSFFLGGLGNALTPTVVRLPADEILPWGELVADPGIVGERLGPLFHLAQGPRFPALVHRVRAPSLQVPPLAAVRSVSRPGQ